VYDLKKHVDGLARTSYRCCDNDLTTMAAEVASAFPVRETFTL